MIAQVGYCERQGPGRENGKRAMLLTLCVSIRGEVHKLIIGNQFSRAYLLGPAM
jgi:hypothetical protein